MKICKYCGVECEPSVSVCASCGGTEFKNKCDNCGTVFDAGNFCPVCGVKVGSEEKICPDCGTKYYSVACPGCGYMPNRQRISRQAPYTSSGTSAVYGNNIGKRACNKYLALCLCILFGYFGVHKFYEGKKGMGLLYLFTVGLFGIGWIVDVIVLACKPETYYV